MPSLNPFTPSDCSSLQRAWTCNTWVIGHFPLGFTILWCHMTVHIHKYYPNINMFTISTWISCFTDLCCFFVWLNPGVYRAGQDEEDVTDRFLLSPNLNRRDSDSSTLTRLSATFHAQPECPPTPPLPSPPLLPSPPPSPPLDPPTLDLPPPPPLPPPTPTSFHSGTLLSSRLSQISNGSSSDATNSIHGDTSFLLYKGCDYDPQPQGIDNLSYEKSTADDQEGSVQGERVPSFYSVSPTAQI